MGAAGARGRAGRSLGARVREAAAVVGLGLLITAAALTPALAARGSATTEVTGRVVAAGVPLAGVPVGFWSPTGGVRTQSRTRADGRFVLTAPTYVDGFVFAGRSPVAESALFRAGRRILVRGVVGAQVRRGTAWPLMQGYPAATPRNIGGGRPLTLSLAAAGRITASSGLLGSTGGRHGTVQVRRFDGSVVQAPTLDANGRFTSGPLAPGVYSLLLTPRAPYLPQAVPAPVYAGRTTPIAVPAFARGATLTGRITAAGQALTAAVPVQLLRDGRVAASVTTTRSGAYTVPGLSPGAYRLEAGRFPEAGTPVDPVPPTSVVPSVPATSPTPTPTPTPTSSPSPSPSPSSPTVTGAPTSGRPTADQVLPDGVDVVVPADQPYPVQDLDLQPAGRVAGTVRGTTGAEVDVFLEDPSSHVVLRSTRASADGAFELGGLVPGTTYAVYAIDRPGDAPTATYGSATVTADDAVQRVDVTLGQPALTLRGRVGGNATGGTVTATGVELLGREAPVGKDGSYTLDGLVPAAYAVAASEPDRATGDPATVVVESAATKDLDRGPEFASYKAWFISAGAGVPAITGRAVDGGGGTVAIGPRTRAGHVLVRGLIPGTYSYDAASFVGAAPTHDGPWFFGPPIGTFTLRGGSTTDVGPVTLRLRAR